MLFAAETFVVVPFHLEELLEVSFAVDDALQCCVRAQTEHMEKRVRVCVCMCVCVCVDKP